MSVSLGDLATAFPKPPATTAVPHPLHSLPRQRTCVLSRLCGAVALLLQIAKRQAVVNPENTFFSVKRFVGRRMSEVTEECKQVPYVVSIWQSRAQQRGRGAAAVPHGCRQGLVVLQPHTTHDGAYLARRSWYWCHPHSPVSVHVGSPVGKARQGPQRATRRQT